MNFRPPRKRKATQWRGTVGGRRNCALPNHIDGKVSSPVWTWARDAVAMLLNDIRAELNATQPGPWVEWSGGLCPIPDAPLYGFELRLRNGKSERPTQKAGWFSWRHRGDDLDIVAYRLVSLTIRSTAGRAP